MKGRTAQQALVVFLERCTVTEDKCLIWPGATSGFGYPVANLNGRGTFCYIHREIYQYCVGIIPDGWQVDHICKNRRCLNPDHLRVIWPSDNNVRDRWTDSNPVYDFLRRVFDDNFDNSIT